MKKWYYVREGVEYSTDFEFFKSHQVAYNISKVGHQRLSIYSLLDGRIFYQHTEVFGRDLEKDVPRLIKEIHKDLLDGKFYPNGVLKD